MRDIVGKMLAATVCQSPEQQRREIVKDNNALRKSLAKAEGAIKRRDELIEELDDLLFCICGSSREAYASNYNFDRLNELTAQVEKEKPASTS